jgi:hypothetical protein
MVEHSGTSGEPHVSARINRLEEALARLSEESIRTQGAISTLAKHLDGQADALERIADKLDEQRTKRPELGALATWSLVIIALGGLALYPLQQSQERFHERLTHQEYLVDEVRGSRFTKEDGQGILDKLLEHIQSAVDTCEKDK